MVSVGKFDKKKYSKQIAPATHKWLGCMGNNIYPGPGGWVSPVGHLSARLVLTKIQNALDGVGGSL